MQNGGEGKGGAIRNPGGLAVLEKTFSSQSDNFVCLFQLQQNTAVFHLRKMRSCSGIPASSTAFCSFTAYARAKRLITVIQNQDTQGQN